MPPSLRGITWSASQREARTSQPDSCWQWRSRTSTIRRTPPTNVRRWDASTLRLGRSYDDPFDVGVGQVGQELAGGDDDAISELAQPLERFVAEEHGQQRAGPQPVDGRRGRTHRHLDEGVEAALLHGAHHTVAVVLEVERLAAAVQLLLEDLPADGVEHGLEVALTAPPGADRAVPPLTDTLGVVLAGFGVDALLPVVDDTHGVGEPRCLALLDEVGLVVGKRRLATRRAGGGEQIDVVAGELAGGERFRGGWHLVEGAGLVDEVVGDDLAHPALAGQAGAGRLRAIVGPDPSYVPLADRPAPRRVQPVRLPAEADDEWVELVVVEGGGVDVEQFVDRASASLPTCHHHIEHMF